MKTEEAIRLCEFWTMTGSAALGTTSNPEVGIFFDGDEFEWEAFSNPGRKGWAIRVPKQTKDGPFFVDNMAFKLIEQEIEKRVQSRTEGS